MYVTFLHDEAMDGHEKLTQRYLEPDLLIIDDLGRVQLPRPSLEYLFEVIIRRHERRSTMMTSNRPSDDWCKLIGDVPSATAILDRFLHRAELYIMANFLPVIGEDHVLVFRATGEAILRSISGEEKILSSPHTS